MTPRFERAAPLDPKTLARRARRVQWVSVLAALILFASACAIAGTTRYNAHPDEHVHADAFRYFEDHHWPPDLNADDLVYSAFGWSRVYTGELVYPLYGAVGGVIKSIIPSTEHKNFYRWLNVALFALTLAALLLGDFSPLPSPLMRALALGFPQLVYLYSYANSDAFGLSCSLFILLAALALYRRPADQWPVWLLAVLGIFAGCLLAAKVNYLAGLVLPLLALTLALWRDRSRIRPGKAIAAALLPLCLAVAVAAPYAWVYKASQSDRDAQVLAMREQRARPGFKPSTPLESSYPTMRLAEKGETHTDLLLKRGFLQTMAASFWGMFGFMNIVGPRWLYWLVYAILGALFVLNALAWRSSWFTRAGPFTASPLLRTAPPVSLLVCLGLTIAVLHMSLTVDYQPQGRYLYAVFWPILVLLAGCLEPDKPSGRVALWLARGLWVLGLYALWGVLLVSPEV